MKRTVVVIFPLVVLFTGAASMAMANDQCPEGQYFDTQRRRCITPGDGDPSADREFVRQIKAECHSPCGDGWCCREDSHCSQCVGESGQGKKR